MKKKDIEFIILHSAMAYVFFCVLFVTFAIMGLVIFGGEFHIRINFYTFWEFIESIKRYLTT